ncbi:MAG TPA: flagellar biosynthesis protein FlhB [Solirubrobacteraceae bacterium]|nr:flagellar biosynthesis protein FlhB [Solirubrobacteraceae bacterium]
MADGHDRDQRTEAPTQKRLQDARERGEVPRSRELTGAAVMIAGSAALLLLGGGMAAQLGGFMRDALSAQVLDAAAPGPAQLLGRALLDGGIALAPLFAAVTLAAVLAPALLGGWVFSGQALAPNPSRLNPVAGLGRMFGANGLAELVKSLAKFLLVGGAAAAVFAWMFGDMMRLGAMAPGPALHGSARLLATAGLAMCLPLVAIAAADAPFQAWSHRRRLRMTRQELREELKETDARPEVRSRLRAAQRELARRRMMQEVPTASVVITNPTHYSVALRYEAERMRAPRVVAKGKDLVALEIRRVAREHGVPLFEAPSLARAVFASTPLYREVPAALYVAVAQVLAYVFQVAAAGGQGARIRRPDPRVDDAPEAP